MPENIFDNLFVFISKNKQYLLAKLCITYVVYLLLITNIVFAEVC